MENKKYNLRIKNLEYGSVEVQAETPEQAKNMVQNLLEKGMINWFDSRVVEVVAEEVGSTLVR